MKGIIDNILFIVINSVIAYIQAKRFNNNEPINKWYHTLWAIPVVAYIVVTFILDHNYDILFSLILLRCVYFSQLLNLLRVPKVSFFYLHSDQTTGSWEDKFMLKIKPAYAYIWTACLIGWIVCLLKIVYIL